MTRHGKARTAVCALGSHVDRIQKTGIHGKGPRDGFVTRDEPSSQHCEPNAGFRLTIGAPKYISSRSNGDDSAENLEFGVRQQAYVRLMSMSSFMHTLPTRCDGLMRI